MIIGIGTDLVEQERIEALLAKYEGRFAKKVFTETEREYADARALPHTHYGARFAAKESFLKAVGLGLSNGMRWKDAGIVNDKFGKPEMVLTGKARQRALDLGATHIHVTLSHSRGHAVAVVILERRGDDGEFEGMGRAID